VPSNCLDAGVLSLFFMRNTPKNITLLMDQVKKNPENTYIAKEILIEVYKHLCILKGSSYAESVLQSFYKTYSVHFVNLTPELIVKAGKLKCQHRAKLSYNDCIAIAISLQVGALFHTTEKDMPNIPHLNVKSYAF
jgi:predicted nucleic acid-binding protein